MVFLAGAGFVAATAYALWISREDLRPLPMTVTNGSLLVNGEPREFRLVIPDGVREETDVPVVFALHGALDTTAQMAQYTGLDQLAVEGQFLLVYLQGRHLNWPPFIPPENPDLMVPDIQFFAAAIEELVEKYGADRQRIYLVGVSQGGAMANFLTTQCSDLIAATVCGCGWLPDPLGSQPLATTHKCPMLFFVGSLDEQVSPATVRRACEAFQLAGHPVEFRTIDGFGHGWPRGIEFNRQIWHFLSAHRRTETRESVDSGQARQTAVESGPTAPAEAVN